MYINRFKEILKDFIRQNYIFFFLILIVFLIGVFFGALSLKTLNTAQKKELLAYLNSFFQSFTRNDTQSLLMMKMSLLNNLKTIGLIWIFGLTVIGAPLILLIIFTRGFIFGFAVGFLVEHYSYKGFLFTLLAIVPQNLLIFPVLLFVSIISLNLAKNLIQQRFGRRPAHLGSLIPAHIIALASSGIILIFASMLEAYVSPFFIALLAKVMR